MTAHLNLIDITIHSAANVKSIFSIGKGFLLYMCIIYQLKCKESVHWERCSISTLHTLPLLRSIWKFIIGIDCILLIESTDSTTNITNWWNVTDSRELKINLIKVLITSPNRLKWKSPFFGNGVSFHLHHPVCHTE